MIETTSLRSEHCRIQDLANALSRIVMRPLPPEPAELDRVRRDFTIGVSRHLNYEDAIVYPQLLESDDVMIRAAAGRLIAESATLTARFDAYCRRWSRAAIAADWSGFRYASSELLVLIERRIAAEEYELYPLIDGEGENGRPSRWTGTGSHMRLQLQSAGARR
jgi:hypothetical protein